MKNIKSVVFEKFSTIRPPLLPLRRGVRPDPSSPPPPSRPPPIDLLWTALEAFGMTAGPFRWADAMGFAAVVALHNAVRRSAGAPVPHSPWAGNHIVISRAGPIVVSSPQPPFHRFGSARKGPLRRTAPRLLDPGIAMTRLVRNILLLLRGIVFRDGNSKCLIFDEPKVP